MNWFSVGPALALPPGNVCLKNIPTVHSGFRLLKIAISMTCPRFAAPGRKPLLRGIRRRARAGLAPASFSDGFYYTTKAPAFQFQKAVFSRAVSRPAGQKNARSRALRAGPGDFSFTLFCCLFVSYRLRPLIQAARAPDRMPASRPMAAAKARAGSASHGVTDTAELVSPPPHIHHVHGPACPRAPPHSPPGGAVGAFFS